MSDTPLAVMCLAAIGIATVGFAIWGIGSSNVNSTRGVVPPQGQVIVVNCDKHWLLPGGKTKYEATKIRKGWINHTLTLTDGRLVEVRWYQCRWETEYRS